MDKVEEEGMEERGSEGRRQMERRVMAELRVAGARRGRRMAREGGSQVSEGWTQMLEGWMDGQMDEGEGTVITGLVLRLERWRSCFFSTATLH